MASPFYFGLVLTNGIFDPGSGLSFFEILPRKGLQIGYRFKKRDGEIKGIGRWGEIENLRK